MKPGRFLFLLILFGTLVFGLYPAAGAATVYVDGVNGNDSNDGSAWDKAKRTIGAGVNAALAEDIVLVAKATYTLSAPITVNKNLTIRSQDGYAQTIIDGNLAVNHCFYLYHYTQMIQVTIEGFTIRNGNATGVTYYPEYNGGGICIDFGARATIRNCYITKNKAVGHGGGVFFGTYGNVLENSFLVENTAKGGGGVAGNNVTVRGCTVTGNTATGDAFLDGGGGVSSTNGGGLVENSTFTSNTAKAGGGGVFFNVGGVVRNCTFTGNQAQQGYGNGGGVFSGAQGTVEHCTFSKNFAYGYGGGVYMTGGGLIRYCTISENNSGIGGGVYIHGSGTVESSTIQNNTGNRGAGVGLGFEYAVARNCTISGNVAVGSFQEGGGVYLSGGGTVERCLIRDNRARVGGGAYFHYPNGRVISSLLLANQAQGVEPGFQGQGSAAYFYRGGYLLNCTVAGNVMESPGVTLYFDEGGGGVPVGTVRNSIVWGNTASQGSTGGSPSSITYSLVQGWTGGGEGTSLPMPSPVSSGPGTTTCKRTRPAETKAATPPRGSPPGTWPTGRGSSRGWWTWAPMNTASWPPNSPVRL